MAQKGDRRRGKPLNPDLGYSGDPVHHAPSHQQPQRIGIRELRQHASVYVDLVERGYTVDITNRGRLVAQMIPVRDPESPLERWIAKGVIERAEDDGSVLEIDAYPGTSGGQATASQALEQLRGSEQGTSAQGNTAQGNTAQGNTAPGTSAPGTTEGAKRP